MFKYSELDINNIEKIVGETYKERAREIMKVLKVSNTPLMLTGFSGTGKTITAKNIAAKYAKLNNVPAYFIQLSPDQTKTNIILGLRLINGTLTACNGVVAECMEQGGIIVVDEATHATQSLLLMFNSLMDTDSISSIGDKIIRAKDTFRIIFCCNDSSYAGNTKLPQSFCSRLIAYYFDYPSFEEETKILSNMLKNKDIKIDVILSRYLIGLVRELRSSDMPLSVRNAFSASLLISVTSKTNIEDFDATDKKMETKFKKLLSTANNIRVEDITLNDILEDEETLKVIYSIGIEKLNEIIKQSYMYYLDIDQSVVFRNAYKKKVEDILL